MSVSTVSVGVSDQYSCFESKNKLTCLSSNKNHLNTLMHGTSVCTTEYCNIYQLKQDIACHNVSALHVNIRSLIKNMAKLKDMLTDMSVSPDLIAISETWLTNSKTVNVNLPVYNFLFANSPKRKQNSKHTAGGVGMFVKKSLSATQTELSILCKDCEDLWLELELPNQTKVSFWRNS